LPCMQMMTRATIMKRLRALLMNFMVCLHWL
jgi:hypothetical protein